MAAYALVGDIQARMTRTLDTGEQGVCSTLLEDAAVMIDAVAPGASVDAKKIVSCRMVIRAIGEENSGYPIGASQGSQSALGYVQSWTVGSGGVVGELYISKQDRRMLGIGDRIGSRSPVEDLVCLED